MHRSIAAASLGFCFEAHGDRVLTEQNRGIADHRNNGSYRRSAGNDVGAREGDGR